MSRLRAGAGLLGLVVGGAAAGLAGERYAVGRTRRRPDPDAREPFFGLPADRTAQVRADDGVLLHVEEVGPTGADLTIVFCHGYTQELAVWHYQRLAFAEQNPGRLLFWDQRSHGRSGRSSPEHATVDQLGSDLEQVLAQRVPTGRVVLVGHSMGGMTIMALADRRPDLFGPRVAGVALLSTSAGKLSELTFGLPARVTGVSRHALPFLTRELRLHPAPFEHGRRIGTDLAFVVSRRMAFGTSDVSPSLVEFVEKMTANTKVDVIAEFYDTFVSHDKLSALGVLDPLPVLVLVGSRDRVTPEEHSAAIAEALPRAQLVVVQGAGHMVPLERAALVNLHLRTLLQRVRG